MRHTAPAAYGSVLKMRAAGNAQTIFDRAVQLFGGRGLKTGEVVENLYREIRALRICESAAEVQTLIIGRKTLKE